MREDEMTDLTVESLEQAIMEIHSHLNSRTETIGLRPTKLIVSPSINRHLKWRSPIKMASGVRGRKKAMYSRTMPLIWKIFREGGQA